MNTIDKIFMIDSVTDEITELIDHINNAKSKALKDRLQKELDMKREVLEGFKCSLADDIVESTLYSTDDDFDEDDDIPNDDPCSLCDICDEPCCDCFESDEEDENVALLRRVAKMINHTADCLEENGKVKVTVD